MRTWGIVMRRSAVMISICAFLLGGCAIHPLPENVTRDTTYDIVQKIRCEGKEALDNITQRLVRLSTDPTTIACADRVEAGELSFVELFEKHRASLQLTPYPDKMLGASTLSALPFDFCFAITNPNHNNP